MPLCHYARVDVSSCMCFNLLLMLSLLAAAAPGIIAVAIQVSCTFVESSIIILRHNSTQVADKSSFPEISRYRQPRYRLND